MHRLGSASISHNTSIPPLPSLPPLCLSYVAFFTGCYVSFADTKVDLFSSGCHFRHIITLHSFHDQHCLYHAFHYAHCSGSSSCSFLVSTSTAVDLSLYDPPRPPPLLPPWIPPFWVKSSLFTQPSTPNVWISTLVSLTAPLASQNLMPASQRSPGEFRT